MIVSNPGREAQHVIIIDDEGDSSTAAERIFKTALSATTEFEDAMIITVASDDDPSEYILSARRATDVIASRWQALNDQGVTNEHQVFVILPLLENVLAKCDDTERLRLKFLTVDQYDNASEVGVHFLVGAHSAQGGDARALAVHPVSESETMSTGTVSLVGDSASTVNQAREVADLIRGSSMGV